MSTVLLLQRVVAQKKWKKLNRHQAIVLFYHSIKYCLGRSKQNIHSFLDVCDFLHLFVHFYYCRL